MTKKDTARETWERPAVMRMAAADAEAGRMTTADGHHAPNHGRHS